MQIIVNQTWKSGLQVSPGAGKDNCSQGAVAGSSFVCAIHKIFWLLLIFACFQTLSVQAAPGSFSLSNLTPVCDQNPPAGPAVTLNWTAASGSGVTYQVYRNSSPVGSPISGLTFYNNAGLTAGEGYTSFIRARNSGGTTDSQTISLPIPANVCGTTPQAPTITSQP